MSSTGRSGVSYPVAQLDSYKGTHLRHLRPRRSTPAGLPRPYDMVSRRHLRPVEREASRVIGGIHKWIVPCNWKFPAENFIGDTYHFLWSHMSSIFAGFSPRPTTQSDQSGTAVSPGNGHGIFTVASGSTRQPTEVLDEYEAQIRAAKWKSGSDLAPRRSTP